jgi:chaperonin GroES
MDLDLVDPYPGMMDEYGEGPFIPLLPEASLAVLSEATGDVSGYMRADEILALGMRVVEDYEKDKSDRDDWERVVTEALDSASQEAGGEAKAYPWPNCANIRYPMLTTAALQFNARAYPAIVKGDEAVSVKVVGRDQGKPSTGPDGQPLVQGPDGQVFPASMAAQAPPEVQQMLQPVWQVPPGGKAARAVRVSEYMNTVLFYRMYDWEADTDNLLINLPIVGCVFRKVWFDADKSEHRSAMVSALRIIVPEGARSCETTPRLTEEIPDVYPHEINEKIRSGFYREVVIPYDDETKAGGRLLLEQHRLIDIDGDGIEEPYIVTVDKETGQVLRIEPNYAPEDVRYNEAGEPVSIAKGKFYIKYDFFPHPKGKFYGIGLGHLLKQVGHVVDTALNQLIDAGTAQTAGGGFIASGVRLQGRQASLRFQPGEYKTVEGISGNDLRGAIVERTLPNVSPVTYQVLDLILGAARDISGVKDVVTGEASNTGQVGTTLALIEQGLMVYTACYKRVHRALKEEFTLLYKNIGRYGVEQSAQDYAEVMDDPQADFDADFGAKDMDIRPVSDPTSSTRMQRGAKAQALLGTVGIPGANPQAILKRYYEALEMENPDELLMPPAGPDPLAEAKAAESQASAINKQADAEKKLAEKAQTEAETSIMERQAAYAEFASGYQFAA